MIFFDQIIVCSLKYGNGFSEFMIPIALFQELGSQNAAAVKAVIVFFM